MSSFLRALFAYILACLAAAIVIVLFVKTPAELLALPTNERLDSLASTGMLILAAATQSAIFAAAFAAIAILLGAVMRIHSALFYSLVGLAISFFGFAALQMNEPVGAGTILNSYAATAYALSGIVGGWVYWLLAGRHIGRRRLRDNANPGDDNHTQDRTPPPIVPSKN